MVKVRSLSTKQQAVSKVEVGRMIKSALIRSSELKYAVNAVGAGNMVATGEMIPLSQYVIQGTGIDQHTGDKIIVKRLTVRINYGSASNLQTGLVRFIVFHDRDAQAALPNTTDLLESSDPMAPYARNWNAEKRFVIHKDVMISPVAVTSTAQGAFTWVFPMNLPVHYLGTTNASTANGSNSLFLLAITDNTSFTRRFYNSIQFTDA